MPRIIIIFFYSLFILGVSLSALAQDTSDDNNGTETNDDIFTGMLFAEESIYRSIPQAMAPFGSGKPLPSSVDLSENFPPPGDQGNQNSCVGWAVAYALKSFQEYEEEGWSLVRNNGMVNRNRVFSPSYIYNQINNGRDAGSHFNNAFRLLSLKGVPPMSDMPYNPNDYRTQPTTAMHNAAANYKIGTWSRVNPQDVKEIKAHINAGYPIVIGAKIDRGFMSMFGNSVWEQFQGNTLGGHAMVVVGYDDDKSAFKLINSFGQNWGDNGYGWVSYNHFPRVTVEAYIVQDLPNSNRPVSATDTSNETRTKIAEVARTESDIRPPSADGADIQFTIGQAMHNVPVPGGRGSAFRGFFRFPTPVDGELKIEFEITTADGEPVRVMGTGYGVTDTGNSYVVGPQRIRRSDIHNNDWYATISYCALDVPKNAACMPYPMGRPIRTDLILKPKIYLNNYGIAEIEPIHFWVSL